MVGFGAPELLCIMVVFLMVIAAVSLSVILIAIRVFSRRPTTEVRTAIDSCPSRQRLQVWLDGRLGGEDRAQIATHVDKCTQCQRALDRMAGAEHAWSDWAREAITAAPPEPAFARALNQLKDQPMEPTIDSAAPAPSGEPQNVGQLDGYEILSEIGRGGMGVVLKAFDPKLRRVVAIKVLAPHLAANAAARERFQREARAAAAVAHEHVVTIHAVEESSAGTPYIVMQFIPGKSLQDRIDQSGPLALPEALRIGMQTAAGLAAAHAQGLIHRDIKPANILLENGIERVKLADFGLARASDDASLTRSGVVTGSPQFMSPEQARGETVDSRSDLFGLGCVLYAMCAGHPPFRAPSPLAVLKRVCDDEPRSLREVNPAIPDWFEAIIFKLLAKDPADRFASAAEVAGLLGQHLRHLQNADAPTPPPIELPQSARSKQTPGPATVSPRPASKSSRRVILIVAACIAGLFLLCAGVPALAIMALWLRGDPGRGATSMRVVTQAPSPEIPPIPPLPDEFGHPPHLPKPQRGLIETLKDPNAKEFECMRGLFNFKYIHFDPTTRVLEWRGHTTTKDFKMVEAQVNLDRFTDPITFYNKEKRSIGTAAFKVELGAKEPDGSYFVIFKLPLTEEIVKNAVSFEFHGR